MDEDLVNPGFETPDRASSGETAAMEYSPDSGEAGGVGASLLGLEGVEGVGRGKDRRGNDTIVVFVRDQAVAARLPSELGGSTVVVEVVGRIDALGVSTPD